jgi:hypothetical protein
MKLLTTSALMLTVLLVAGRTAAEPATNDKASPAITSSNPQNSSRITRFAVRQDRNGWWLAAPGGEPFFSLGVCMFNQGTLREAYDPAKPRYSALRHYDTTDRWAEASLARLRTWGFTTIGGWSDFHLFPPADGRSCYFTPVLHSGSTAGVPWFDVWDVQVVRRVEEVAEKGMLPLRGDPRVIGYYSDNELGWWNGILWKMTLEQPATSGQRQRLVALVRKTYGDDWNALNEDFEPQGAANWQELESAGMLWLRPGTDGIKTIRRFLHLVADRYYQLMRDTIRKLDDETLYLGDRYQSFYYPEVVRASVPYVDVASTNLNSTWNDGTFLRSYLDSLHALSGKPVIVSEFYMAAAQNRSGNKNTKGTFPRVATQAERAKAIGNTLKRLVRLPYVVGADWFQYYDEPPHGRKLDGEDYNFGLVDINDRPYTEVTAAFAALDLPKLKSASPTVRPNAAGGIPPAPAAPFAPFDGPNALQNWDRERGFVPPATDDPTGDLYVCWSPKALYIGLYVLDIVELEYYRNAEIPEIDRAEWTVRVDDDPPITARIGAGRPLVVSDPDLRVESLSGLYNDVRCVAAIELPARRFGKQQFEPGDQIALEAEFASHARAHHIKWKGTFELSD